MILHFQIMKNWNLANMRKDYDPWECHVSPFEKWIGGTTRSFSRRELLQVLRGTHRMIKDEEEHQWIKWVES